MANSKTSGSHYALTAIGVGLLVLGVVMAVWNLAPGFGNNDQPPPAKGNSSKPTQKDDSATAKSKTVTVAYVLVGSGIVLLLLAICLTIRARKRRQRENTQRNRHEASALPQEQEDNAEDTAPQYAIPSYEEVMGPEFSATEGTDLERNARISVSLPSYESVNELDETTPTAVSPKEGPSNRHQLSKRNSRSDKARKPLKVRRIKSDKLHLKDFRLKLSNKNALAQTIEPLTPPPQYEGKTFESTNPAVNTNAVPST